MPLYIAVADFEGDATAEVPELSFREGDRIMVVDDDALDDVASRDRPPVRQQLISLHATMLSKELDMAALREGGSVEVTHSHGGEPKMQLADRPQVVGRSALARQQSLDRAGVSETIPVDLRGEDITSSAGERDSHAVVKLR